MSNAPIRNGFGRPIVPKYAGGAATVTPSPAPANPVLNEILSRLITIEGLLHAQANTPPKAKKNVRKKA